MECTSWTEVNDLHTGRDDLGGFGTSTSALAFSGEAPPAIANTESWNGTNWTNENDINTGRINPMGSGISTLGLAFGGDPGPEASTLTEEWYGNSTFSKTITTD